MKATEMKGTSDDVGQASSTEGPGVHWTEIRRSAKARTLPPNRAFPFDPMSRGQNGPALALRMADLNQNERRLFLVFDPSNESQQYSIKQLAELAFPELGGEKSYYYVKNQLRRLIRGRLLRKVAAGVYGLSSVGVIVRGKAAH